MNIIFLSRRDPTDISNWSGTLFYMYHKLREKNHVKIMGCEILRQLASFTNGNLPNDFFRLSDRYVKNFGRFLCQYLIQNTHKFDRQHQPNYWGVEKRFTPCKWRGWTGHIKNNLKI